MKNVFFIHTQVICDEAERERQLFLGFSKLLYYDNMRYTDGYISSFWLFSKHKKCNNSSLGHLNFSQTANNMTDKSILLSAGQMQDILECKKKKKNLKNLKNTNSFQRLSCDTWIIGETF